MKKRFLPAVLLLSGAALSAPLSGETLSELFARVKTSVAAGAYAEGLTALSELDLEAQKPENERARGPLRPAAAFYRGVCLAALGQADDASQEFAIFIAANPGKGIDRKTYPPTVVAAFEQARKAGPGGGAAGVSNSPLAFAYRSTAYPQESSAPPGPDWPEGAVKYLLSGEEKSAFARLADDAGRSRFVERFWQARDPWPDTPQNEFRREFERRVAFADENLSDGRKRGSLTDRGMVFVLLGPPTGVIRRPVSIAEDTPALLPMSGRAVVPTPRSTAQLAPSDLPANWKEVWRYRRDLLPAGIPDQTVDFTFVTRTDYGKDLLQRDGPSIRAMEAARPRPRSTILD